MFTKANILKEKYGKNLSTPFLQELIWFHRIKEDQDKELLALEFLNVCASHARVDRLFDKELSTVSYKKDMQVRTIIYNFPELESIVKSSNEEDDKWIEIEKTLCEKSENPYSYKHLKDRFETVDVFYHSIQLLRKASLGLNTSRRWTSKFLFPFSFDTLFVDVDNRKDAFSLDRRFFSRGGEVLYLMVSRGKNADKLKELIIESYKKSPQNKRWNSLLNVLRDDSNIYADDRELGFLGTDNHELFDQLVDDLIKLFELNISQNDIFEHLSSISAYYMVHFIMIKSLEIVKTSNIRTEVTKVVYPIELMAPKSDHVRKSSRQIYKINEDLPLEALSKVFNNYMDNLDNTIDKATLLKKLKDDLNYFYEDNQDEENINLTEIRQDIWKEILKKAKSDLTSIHRVLFKGVGLASVKKTNSYRYLANDEWLKTLVLINVNKRVTFQEFIDLLYKKYGFIISNKHSILLIESYSESDFEKNEQRLFDRLRALGLLENKSDGYAYVINRYGRK
ncbi:hypothetical protein [Arcobacter cloacae]|uniref:Uncharacterized protein n=1 Tax=Arcobacter cloacae TaxID=1054034 RepID=A0A6M8NMH2_9BACT|nr:hypothetical protein [Arcobacter cloacae]QKF89712.1 hypothetical protein ACLO_1211 [Arcobacter cloacae]RXI40709.1 hypothetical protein CP963_07995 [Arcobacter cloacae]